jgi:hypothetical protein
VVKVNIVKKPYEVVTQERAMNALAVAEMLAKIEVVRSALSDGLLRPHLNEGLKSTILTTKPWFAYTEEYHLYIPYLDADYDPSGFVLLWNQRDVDKKRRGVTVHAMDEEPSYRINTFAFGSFSSVSNQPDFETPPYESTVISEAMGDADIAMVAKGVNRVFGFAFDHLGQ